MPKPSQSSARAKKAKSSKADGTPKKRWSADERRTKGLGPRRSGGAPRTEPKNRTERRDRQFGATGDRPRQFADTRAEGAPSSYQRRDDRPSAAQRDDRPRYSRDDRGSSYQPRGERPQYQQRDDRGSSYQRRDDRGASYAPRNDRPSYDRPSYAKRDDRGSSYQPRDDRGAPFAPRNDRPSYAKRDDRGSSYQPRDDRGSSAQRRDDRPSYARRDDRGSSFQSREDRPSSARRDDRGSSFQSREDRPSSARRDDRTDRGPTERRDDRTSSFQPRDDRTDRGPTERRDDRTSSFQSREDRPAYARRDDRGSTELRDDHGSSFQPRDDRSRYSRDDRQHPDRKDFRPASAQPSSDIRPREARPTRGDDTRGAGGWGRDEHRPRQDRESWGTRDRRASRESHDEPNTDQMDWVAQTLTNVDSSHVTDASGFAQLGLPKDLVAALDSQGITEPFPIQIATIPDGLAGRDVLGRGRTGSGKTLGFGLPMITRLAGDRSGIGVRGLVLVPTRELALQVADVLAPLAQVLGLSVALVAGGMAYGPQLRAFERGTDIIVATPGRLIDLMEQGAADLSGVVVTVLDEADHMADLGFWPAVTTIVDATPAGGQRLLFSATLDEAIDALVKRYLHDPAVHEVDSDRASVSTMQHKFWLAAPHHKNELTARVAARGGRTLVFCRTQMGADRVATQLRAAGVMAGSLHGGLTQGARARILAAFKDGGLPVLVATDVAARGIHVDDVSLVLQVDPPMNSKDYVHRSGRTARAGEQGVVLSIVLPHQRSQVKRLASQAGVHAAAENVAPGDDAVIDLVGQAPRDVVPVPEEDYAALIAPPAAKRRASGPSWGRSRTQSTGRFDRRRPRRD